MSDVILMETMSNYEIIPVHWNRKNTLDAELIA
jgi:hypothetical protein